MNIYELALLVFWLHFVGDFMLQTDAMGMGKSKSNLILLTHVSVYSVPLLLIGAPYAIMNAAAHFIVDWFTSRWTSRLYAKGDRHNFFVVIGLDQTIHATCLLLTLYYFPATTWWLGLD